MFYQHPAQKKVGRPSHGKNENSGREDEFSDQSIQTAEVGLPGEEKLVTDAPEGQTGVEHIESVRPEIARQRLNQAEAGGRDKMTLDEINRETSDMISVIEYFPRVRLNFNLTPVLLLQIKELVNGDISDLWLEWSKKPAASLDEDDRMAILENFFKINWDNPVKLLHSL